MYSAGCDLQDRWDRTLSGSLVISDSKPRVFLDGHEFWTKSLVLAAFHSSLHSALSQCVSLLTLGQLSFFRRLVEQRDDLIDRHPRGQFLDSIESAKKSKNCKQKKI